MNSTIPPSADDRESLEQRANAVRAKLMRTIGALDQKRHEVFDVRLQLRRHLTTLALLGGAVALGLGGGVVALVFRFERTSSRIRRERWRAIGRGFRHPDRIARGDGGIGGAIVKRVVGGVLTTIAVQLARRAMERLLSRDDERALRLR